LLDGPDLFNREILFTSPRVDLRLINRQRYAGDCVFGMATFHKRAAFA